MNYPYFYIHLQHVLLRLLRLQFSNPDNAVNPFLCFFLSLFISGFIACCMCLLSNLCGITHFSGISSFGFDVVTVIGPEVIPPPEVVQEVGPQFL